MVEMLVTVGKGPFSIHLTEIGKSPMSSVILKVQLVHNACARKVVCPKCELGLQLALEMSHAHLITGNDGIR